MSKGAHITEEFKGEAVRKAEVSQNVSRRAAKATRAIESGRRSVVMPCLGA